MGKDRRDKDRGHDRDRKVKGRESASSSGSRVDESWSAAASKGKARRAEAAAAYKKNWVAFNEQLRAYGLCLRTIGSDGNCLFRSIADQLLGKQDLHQQIRDKIVDYMLEHPLDYAPFLWDTTLKDYCAQMKKSGSWGGAQELSAAAKCFGINITIHQYNAARLENIYDPNSVTPDPDRPDLLPLPVTPYTKTIHLSYHDAEHYSSVRNISDAHSFDPATPIVIPTHPLVESANSSSSSSVTPALTHQELIVTQSISCSNLTKIKKMLKESWNDPNVVIEMLYAEQAMGLDVNIDYDAHAIVQQQEIQSQKAALDEEAALKSSLLQQQLDQIKRSSVEEEKQLIDSTSSPTSLQEHKSDLAHPDEESKEQDLTRPTAADDDQISDDERDAIAAVQAFQSFDSTVTPTSQTSTSASTIPTATHSAASSTTKSVSIAGPPIRSTPSSSSSSSSTTTSAPKRLFGRDKKLAQKQAKMLAEKEKRLNKGQVKKEKAQANRQIDLVANDLGSVRI